MSSAPGAAFWLVGGSLASLTAAAVVQSLADSRDRDRYPAPGAHYQVGAHRLHALVRGRRGPSQPAIVFESALAANHMDWTGVQAELENEMLTVAYDRAGCGWSDPGPRPRTVAQLAAELHGMLQSAAIAPPYILVGHSYGAFVSRMFAATYPKEIAALVLVDPAHEDQQHRLSRPWPARMRDWSVEQGYRVKPLLSRLGYYRFRQRWRGQRGSDNAPAALKSESTAWDWVWGEAAAIPASARELRRAPHLPTVPFKVLRAHAPENDDVWQTLGRALADSVQGGELQVIEDVGHGIPGERPDIVATAVRDVLDHVASVTLRRLT